MSGIKSSRSRLHSRTTDRDRAAPHPARTAASAASAAAGAPRPARGRWLHAAAWVAVGLWGLAGLLLASTEIVDPDFAFHVGWGRVLLTNFPGASHVTLGQSSAVQSYAYSYWLYQVAVSLVFGSGGAGAVVLLRALLLAAAFFLAVRIALRQGVPVVSIPILLAFALVTAQERFLDRPELVSYVLWVAALGVLMRPGSRDRRALRLLVPILVLWTNTHLSFPLMLGMVGLFAIGERLEGQPLRPRAIQIAVLLLASFLNPAGPLVWRSLEQIVPFFGRGQGLPFRIEEMTSPFGSYQESPAVWAFRIGMPLLVAAALLARRRMPAGALLVLLASALLAARARRAMPLFALTTLCVTPAALRALFEGTRDRERRPATKIARAIGIALVAVPLFAGVVTVLGLANGRIFLALDQDRSIAFRMSPRFPALEAARFLHDQGVQGPVFHNAVAAPAILLENGTRLTPFLDARWRGTPEAVAIYQSIRTAGDAAIAERWKQAMEARGFEAVLLDFYEMPALLRLLDEDPRWAFVHVDETAAVFVRRQGANAAIARRLENAEPLRAGRDPVREQALADAIVRFLNSPAPSLLAPVRFPYGPFYDANLALQLGRTYDTQEAYLRLLQQEHGSLHGSTHRTEILNNLLWALRDADQPAATAGLAAAVATDPATGPEERRNLALRRARALDRLGEDEEAERLARQVVEDPAANPDQKWAGWCRVASIRSEASDFEETAAALRRATEARPGSAETYRSLGTVLDVKLARPAEARESYRRFVELGGDDPWVVERLRALGEAPRGGSPGAAVADSIR